MIGRKRTTRAPDARPPRPTSGQRSTSGARDCFLHLLSMGVALGSLFLGTTACYPDEDIQVAQRYFTSGRVEVQVAGAESVQRLVDGLCHNRDTPQGPVLEVVAPGRERLVNRAGVLMRPKPFIATLPADLADEPTDFRIDSDTGYRAIASLHDVRLGDKRYQMIQFLADPAAAGPFDGDADAYRCQAWREDPHIKVACRGARPFPWTAPGPIPQAQFHARFVCE